MENKNFKLQRIDIDKIFDSLVISIILVKLVRYRYRNTISLCITSCCYYFIFVVLFVINDDDSATCSDVVDNNSNTH